jgi:glycosyltransferase involved in cell wall biosynthesis
MIFDLRGLMAEEYVEAQHWKEGNLPYRLTKTMERRVLYKSDGVVTLTKKIWPIIQKWNGLRDREVVHEVIPCCADLSLFKFSREDRARRREELGLDNRFTLVYSGSIGSWYMSDKMADLFTRLRRTRSNAHFLWLTMGDPELVKGLMAERQLEPDCYTIKQVASRDVPSYLSAADAGIAFYKPGFSKLATSPVKVTEYLACGLPVIVNSGIGDLDTLITDRNLGSLVKEFAQPEYDQAIAALDQSLQDPEAARQRARQAAEQLFDVRGVGVESYARLYERILD